LAVHGLTLRLARPKDSPHKAASGFAAGAAVSFPPLNGFHFEAEAAAEAMLDNTETVPEEGKFWAGGRHRRTCGTECGTNARSGGLPPEIATYSGDAPLPVGTDAFRVVAGNCWGNDKPQSQKPV